MERQSLHSLVSVYLYFTPPSKANLFFPIKVSNEFFTLLIFPYTMVLSPLTSLSYCLHFIHILELSTALWVASGLHGGAAMWHSAPSALHLLRQSRTTLALVVWLCVCECDSPIHDWLIPTSTVNEVSYCCSEVIPFKILLLGSSFVQIQESLYSPLLK